MLYFILSILFYFFMGCLIGRFVFNGKSEDLDNELCKAMFFGVSWPITIFILIFIFIVTYKND